MIDVVIRTLPGRGPLVEGLLGRLDGFGAVQLDGDHRVHATWRGPEDGDLGSLAEALVALDPDIVAVYPATSRR